MMNARKLFSHGCRLPTEIDDGEDERAEDDVNGLEAVLCFIEQKHSLIAQESSVWKTKTNQNISDVLPRIAGFAI